MTRRCSKNTKVMGCSIFSAISPLVSKHRETSAYVSQIWIFPLCLSVYIFVRVFTANPHCFRLIDVVWFSLTDLCQDANTHCCMLHRLQLLAIIISQITLRVSIKMLLFSTALIYRLCPLPAPPPLPLPLRELRWRFRVRMERRVDGLEEGWRG